MHGCAAHLDGNNGVKSSDGRLERLQAHVLVREDAELAFANAQRDTTRDVGLVGAEPGIAGGVLEDVMQERIVSVSDKLA